jgi:hypothetical protein
MFVITGITGQVGGWRCANFAGREKERARGCPQLRKGRNLGAAGL